MNVAASPQRSSVPAPLPASRSAERPIRILHSVGHLLRGGIEMWLYQMIKRLDPARFSHHVLVRTDQEEPFTAAFREIGARVIPCLNYANPAKYASNLRRIVRQHGPYDILHVHGSNPNGLLALLFAKPLGIPATIVHSHNDLTPLLQIRGFAYRSYVSLTLQCLRRFADSGFAVSARAAESMFGSSWQRDSRWSLLHCGVDFEPFADAPDRGLRERLSIPADAFVIGHVGRFHEQKNHAFLVLVAEEAVKRNPRAHFLLIGDGELRAGIVADVERRGLAPHFTFVSDTLAVPQFMLSAMDCLAFPSRYEGLGLVAVEAQAAGLPCVISDRVPREVIVDPGLVTVLPLEGSPASWAAALLNSHRPRQLDPRRHLAQFYATQFNPAQCALSLAGSYELLAARRRSATIAA
jgi:glycosyltransferase involved in cell wall biosynthesis